MWAVVLVTLVTRGCFTPVFVCLLNPLSLYQSACLLMSVCLYLCVCLCLSVRMRTNVNVLELCAFCVLRKCLYMLCSYIRECICVLMYANRSEYRYEYNNKQERESDSNYIRVKR